MKVDVGIEIMLRAFNIHWGKKRKIVRYCLYGLSIIMICFGIWILSKNYYRPHQGYISIIAGTLALVIISFNNSILRWRLSKHFRQMGEDALDVEMSFDSDHLYIKTPKSETKIGWDTFIKWKEESGLILAYRNDAFFQVIPVSQFPENDRSEIRNLLDTNSVKIY